MDHRDRKKKSNPGAIIAVIVLLLIQAPEFIVPLLGLVLILAVIASPIAIAYFVRKNKNQVPARQKEVFDECPKPLCFHKDKGEHHVRRGKEIDPWDRPDIDIRKYQRRS